MPISGLYLDCAIQLVYCGYAHLDLDRIFWGAVVLAAPGALTDIAISVWTTVAEVHKASPSLGLRQLIHAGFEVGRAALGTMIATLLFAYMGCSMFLVLVLVAKHTSLVRILNLNFVSAEILRTWQEVWA